MARADDPVRVAPQQAGVPGRTVVQLLAIRRPLPDAGPGDRRVLRPADDGELPGEPVLPGWAGSELRSGVRLPLAAAGDSAAVPARATATAAATHAFAGTVTEVLHVILDSTLK